MFPALRLGALAVFVMFSCKPSPQPRRSASDSADSTLPDYGAQMRILFDDELGGVSLEGGATPTTAESMKLLSRRILGASSVIACQIRTLTEGSAGDATYARLEFRGVGQSLSHGGRAECPTIAVSPQSYSFLLIRHSSKELIGRSIVLFLRYFNERGQETLHWHGEPDGPWIREEVKRIGSPIH